MQESLIVGIIMLLCVIPVVLICFFCVISKKMGVVKICIWCQ